MKRIISSILVLATILSCLAVLPFGAWAEGLASGGTLSELRPVQASGAVAHYLRQAYYSAQDKIDRDENMDLWVTYGNMELYANPNTGEVYVKNKVTGDILHSNPYDMTDVINAEEQYRVMSQILLTYKEGSTYKPLLSSFKDSAGYAQIDMEPIANGIRVNYAIGDTTKRYLLPYGMPANDLIELLFIPLHKQVEKDMREAAIQSGVPQKYIDKYFNFENYCAKNPSFSTEKSLGVNYTYGNNEAFARWSKAANTFYENYYDYSDYEVAEQGDDPEITRTSAEQASMTSDTDMKDLDNDFAELNQVFVLITPYITYNGNDPSNDKMWVLSDKINPTTPAKSAIPYLAERGTHPILGVEYYCNALYALDDTLTATKLRRIEALFGNYVPGFTLTAAVDAEEETGISPPASEKPVFYLSLEYTLTEDGVKTEVPATSIMYDESKYTITDISILPYMGSANVNEDGYIFYPDGSGAIVEFDEFRTSSATLSGKFYGHDFSYYTITGQHRENISMPVFGTVYDENRYAMNTPYGKFYCSYKDFQNKSYTIKFTMELDENNTPKFYANLPFGVKKEVTTAYVLGENGYYDRTVVLNAKENDTNNYSKIVTEIRAKDFEVVSEKQGGFFAIVEEGSSLSTLKASMTPSVDNPMSAVYISFIPRCEDSYNLADNLSSDNNELNASFTVLADDKYMGSYTTRYIMLIDEKTAEEKNLTTYYPPSYIGMAAVYRNYLIREGVLSEGSSFGSQLPLYIESFGTMKTREKFMSIPFTVDVALTTFDDIETMYKALSDEGIKNVKFRLTGFANGGMAQKYPVKLKWEKEAGGKSGFEDLLAYASADENKKAGLEIYPNFNFLYVLYTGTGDGINIKKIGARSVDNRYAVRKTYSSVYQTYTFSATDGLLVNASKLTELFTKFDKKYSKYGHSSLSLAGMASNLSGDFSEDNGLTREEALIYIEEMLDVVDNSYTSIMSDGGNVYALKYMSHLLEAPIDSSHFRSSSRTIPFWGMVVHGHIQYAGSPFNEESNKNEALLRAIESGAALYFLLSYDNTRLMKENSMLNEYYSVNYQISHNTVVEYYNILNKAIGDLQSWQIVDHKAISVERVGNESDRAAQLAELRAELLLNLEKEANDLVASYNTLFLAIKALSIDANAERAMFDIDGDGVLSEAEADTAWTKVTEDQKDIAIKSLVKLNSDHAMMVDLIGNVNLDIDDKTAREAAEDAAAKTLYLAVVNGRISTAYGQVAGVAFDEESILASAREKLAVETLDAEFEAEIRALMGKLAIGAEQGDFVAKMNGLAYTPAHSYFTTSNYDDSNYKTTESTVSDGTVVMVTYSNGTESVSFILNYNTFSVNVRIDGKVISKPIGKYGFLRID